jgi:energy-coupling factor transport system substrate-specific component
MTPRELALVPVAVALNVAMGVVVAQLGLPVYLDTLGTVLAVSLAGLRCGLIVGGVSQVIAALNVGAFMLLFMPIQALVAVGALLACRAGGLQSLPKSLAWGAAIGLVGGAASAGISYVVFKGVTAIGVTAVVSALRAIGLPLAWAVTGASMSTDLIDKLLVLPVAGTALRALPLRLRYRFPLVQRATGLTG